MQAVCHGTRLGVGVGGRRGAVQRRGGAGVGLGGAMWAVGAVGFGSGVLVLAGVALAGRRAAGVGVAAALLGWRRLSW